MDLERARVQIQEAWRQLIGVPYSWGGKTRAGLDCSGTIQLGWQSAGVWPFDGEASADMIWKVCQKIDWQDRQIGDAVAFGDGGVAHHVVGVFSLPFPGLAGQLIGANHGGPRRDGESEDAYRKRMAAAQPRPAQVELVGDDYWASKRLGVVRAPRLAMEVDG